MMLGPHPPNTTISFQHKKVELLSHGLLASKDPSLLTSSDQQVENAGVRTDGLPQGCVQDQTVWVVWQISARGAAEQVVRWRHRRRSDRGARGMNVLERRNRRRRRGRSGYRCAAAAVRHPKIKG